MSTVSPLRLGQINLTGDTDAMFLKQFSNEVLAAFTAACLYKDKTHSRELRNAKAAQFPAMGRIKASYHIPGAELTGSAAPIAEVVIPVDGICEAHHYSADIDEMKNHYDARSYITAMMGDALAQIYDRHVSSMVYKAARSAATVTGEQGGSILNAGVNVASDADQLKKAFFTCAQILDEKNVPKENRYAFVPPKIFYLAAQTPNLIDRNIGGEGSIAKGVIGSLAGIQIVNSNNTLAGINFNDTTLPAKYHGDYTKAAFQVFHPSAVGTVNMLDIVTEKSRETRNLADLIVSKYVAGHGVLRPESAIEVRAVAP